MGNWLLYGAYGYTGQLLAEEAVRRGHRPVLAGRNEAKLVALGRQMNLPWQAFDLSDPVRTAAIVAKFDAVMHAAGPFVHTAVPMIEACLSGQAHYLDITGEITVLENTLGYYAHAREQGVALVSGVGFDIVPTDCLGAYVAGQLADASELSIAIKSLSEVSAGTANTMIEMLGTQSGGPGSLVRRNGKLVPQALQKDTIEVTFSDGRTQTVFPIPWGDLATAETTTGIPNVTTYMALPVSPRLVGLGTSAGKLLQIGPLRQLTQTLISKAISGPDEQVRQNARSYVWAQASNERGESVETWLETVEAYRFTAEAGVRCIEHLLANELAGALTPAQAFGPDFVLEIPGTMRLDSLPQE